MKKQVLISWIGKNDLDRIATAEHGPIASTLLSREFDELELLFNYPQNDVEKYLKELSQLSSITINAHAEPLTSPTNFEEIYEVAQKHLTLISKEQNKDIYILLSPGTPAMQAIWILLGKTIFSAKFIQSSLEQGVQEIEIPFDISAEYIPKIQKNKQSLNIDTLSTDVVINAAFDDIVSQNHEMLLLKERANILASHDIPVLIQGETGTGKELFATAIHNASARKEGPFIPINCGAIPAELIDSILFGHKKGAFTGAHKDFIGAFQQADGGSLFLDEFGELSLDAQVRLLRAIQFGEITPVGGQEPIKVDVRIIAATNRDLINQVAQGRFREDLFYRVAIGILNLPPLRERKGDIGLLIDALFTDVNLKLSNGGKHKKISLNARNILISQDWPGNVRELYATLIRAYVWSKSQKVGVEDIKSSLLNMPRTQKGLLERDISENFNIHDVMGEVAQHYIIKALDESNQNLTQAAQKLGLASYQTLKSWIDKYQVK